MMDLALLDKLVQLYGPSGHEDDVLDFCETYTKQYIPNSAVSRDRFGNVIIRIHPQNSDATILVAHADQIGVVIKYVDPDDGFARFAQIGGWDPAVLLGQRVMIHSEHLDKKIYGVLTRRATHLLTDEEQESVDLNEVWIDFGVFSEGDVELVRPGDAGIIVPHPLIELTGDAISSQALDDRVGVFVALRVALEFADQVTSRGLIVIINRNEESGRFEAAKAAVESVTDAGSIDMSVIAIDVTIATDQPEIVKEKHGDIKLGSGPAIAFGGLLDRGMTRNLVDMSETLGIEYQRDVVTTGTGTDLDGVLMIPRGVRGACVSIPCRYLHTPVEMVSSVDVSNTIDLLLGFCLDD